MNNDNGASVALVALIIYAAAMVFAATHTEVDEYKPASRGVNHNAHIDQIKAKNNGH